MRRGDVVLIVAVGDLGKPRPAIVVQADELVNGGTSVVLCPMSSDIMEESRLRPIVEPTSANGLRIRSQIMTDKIVALGRRRIRRVLGRLDADMIEDVNRSLMVVLGLAG